MNFGKIIKKENIVFGILIIISLVIGFRWMNQKGRVEENVLEEVSMATTSRSEIQNSTEINKMYVDIKGAVKMPGMYEVTSDMRILNVIDLAGGLMEIADEKQINFSSRVEDQMVIYIPKEGENLAEVELPGTAVGANKDNKGKDKDQKVNLNQATKEELMSLNGIGEKKAEKIIDYREENGSFTEIEDLKNVNGFGEKSFDSLKAYITI